MNKADWVDFFFYVKNIFFIKKERKVESINKSNNCYNNYNQDEYKKNQERKNYYGKKRKKYRRD